MATILIRAPATDQILGIEEPLNNVSPHVRLPFCVDHPGRTAPTSIEDLLPVSKVSGGRSSPDAKCSTQYTHHLGK